MLQLMTLPECCFGIHERYLGRRVQFRLRVEICCLVPSEGNQVFHKRNTSLVGFRAALKGTCALHVLPLFCVDTCQRPVGDCDRMVLSRLQVSFCGHRVSFFGMRKLTRLDEDSCSKGVGCSGPLMLPRFREGFRGTPIGSCGHPPGFVRPLEQRRVLIGSSGRLVAFCCLIVPIGSRKGFGAPRVKVRAHGEDACCLLVQLQLLVVLRGLAQGLCGLLKDCFGRLA
ncbi:hypothetical protein PSP20601_05511 [Pandoraea sputorum]|nr:hypothetical protein PSP20601_05511 [Pandoraea sputorum]